ncbi:MAG TPA: 50S ribosomal protein L29 [Kamptonema sp.]|nr:50S ribosomal protein L29 [Kamptonema sp.]
MAFSKIKEARDLSDAELEEQILAIKRQLMELRMLQATNRLEKPHQFKHAKHRLGQLLTVVGERERSQATASSSQ